MKRVALVMLVLMCVAGLVLAGVARRAVSADRVYSVLALKAALARQPRTWAGRTVLVRGIAVGLLGPGCVPGAWCEAGLVDAGMPLDTSTVLPLKLQSAAPLVTLLRRMPPLARFMPAPQALRWGRPATYRIQIHLQPAAACAAPPCYDALLLDAPGAGPNGVLATPVETHIIALATRVPGAN
jgi:hypothetical protein